MAYQPGFTYVKGPVSYVRSTLSSTCTVRRGNPVTLSDDRTIIEAASDTTAIFGISAHDAADSIYPNQMLVEIPTAETVYATLVQTGAATSLYSVGQSYGIEKAANHFRLDTDSQATVFLTIVPRDNFATVDSADSSVWVHWLGNVLGVFGSNASVNIFAQD